MNKVRYIKCILFTDICGGYIAIYHAVDFFEALNVILTEDSTSITEQLAGI